jgi:hypothetical protein
MNGKTSSSSSTSTPTTARPDQNQGEGNRDAARRFNQDEQDFVASGKVNDAAKRAAPQGQKEADEMARAEQAGRRHAKDEDPTVPGANASRNESRDGTRRGS